MFWGKYGPTLPLTLTNDRRQWQRTTVVTFRVLGEVWHNPTANPNERPSSRSYERPSSLTFNDQSRNRVNRRRHCTTKQPRRRRRRVRLKRTNLRVKGLSLNRSQKRTALLSTTPRLRPRSSTNDLAPLRRTWLVSPFGSRTRPSTSAGCRRAVALPPRRPKSVAPRISSPADVEELTVSSLCLDGILT